MRAKAIANCGLCVVLSMPFPLAHSDSRHKDSTGTPNTAPPSTVLERRIPHSNNYTKMWYSIDNCHDKAVVSLHRNRAAYNVQHIDHSIRRGADNKSIMDSSDIMRWSNIAYSAELPAFELAVLLFSCFLKSTTCVSGILTRVNGNSLKHCIMRVLR